MRDLGGLRVAGGGVTRAGILLRSDSLGDLSPIGIERLSRDYGVRLVIDLRSEREQSEGAPNPLVAYGARIVSLPFLDDDALAERGRRLRQERMTDKPPPAGGYGEYLVRSRKPLADAFLAMAAPDGTPAIVHCTAGRDRTGLLVALMLDAAGVEREDIVADYAATGARFSQLARMRVGDVQLEHSRLMVPPSSKGREKVKSYIRIQVGSDVMSALKLATEGRPKDAMLLERWHPTNGPMQWERTGRQAWKTPSEMRRPWQSFVESLGMKDVIPYALRHSSIIRGLRRGCRSGLLPQITIRLWV